MEQKIEEAIQFVHGYAPDIKEWRALKKELLKCLASEARKNFSTRDPVTKKQNFNEFERLIAERWEVISGNTLIFS